MTEHLDPEPDDEDDDGPYCGATTVHPAGGQR